MSASFVHLHVHSEYSLLDGACKHDRLIALAKEYEMPALAVTDHGNLFGAMSFYKVARAAGIKPILGCEVYTVPGDEPDAHTKRGAAERDYNHLLLLCESPDGWRNLMAIVSEGYRRGFYYKPRVSHDVLRRHAKGIVATTACLRGEVPQALMRGDKALADARARRLADTFGAENLYVELQANGVAEQVAVNAALIELAGRLGLPLIATCDVHYPRPEDKKAQDVLLCISTGKKLEDKERMRMEGAFHFRSPREMAEEFDGPDDAISNTLVLASRCAFDLPPVKPRFPKFTPPGGKESAAYFRELCEGGLRERYGTQPSAAVLARYDEERVVIERMGFVPYFLVVADFIGWAKSRGIPVGPGRGSAAGSVIAYALGITDLDPIEWGLLFERFLNKDRVSLPDIDVDFCQERRQEVIDYVRERYREPDGRDAVAQIATFGTLQPKAAIRDVGRVLSIPYGDVDRISKLVPHKADGGKKASLKDAYAHVPALAALRQSPEHEELFSLAERLEGMVRNVGTHAAGIVIADGPIDERVPLYRDPKSESDAIVTQFPMAPLEDDCGLVKMDFLGLKTLTVIKWAIDEMERLGGVRLDLSPSQDPIRAALRDPKEPSAHRVYEMLQRGDSRGVFQFESDGYRDLLVRLRPDSFEDVIALGAIYRPGPLESGMVAAYVERKHGREPVVYDHPSLEPVLSSTYGCMIYQEQVMQITSVLAGFTLSEADSVRKAMGKKKPAEMAKWKDKFIAGATKTCGPEVADRIWHQMEVFAGYGFNRSHAAAYGAISFQTAWLKANHPAAFMAALISSEVGNTEKVVEYVEESERMGIPLLPPDVNASGLRFSVERAPDGRLGIRYGLAGIRGVGEKAVSALIDARAKARFGSIFDVCSGVGKTLNRSALEALIKAGALDGFGKRGQLAAATEAAISFGAREAADRASSQRALFECAPEESPRLPPVADWVEAERLANEKEVLGFYLTGHPLRQWRDTIARYQNASPADLGALAGHECLLAGLVTKAKTKPDKNKNTMAWVTLEDSESASFEAVVFSRLYKEPGIPEAIEPGSAVFVLGRVDEQRASILASDIVPIAQADEVLAERLIVNLGRPDDERLKKLTAALEKHRGDREVLIDVETKASGRVRIRVGEALFIAPSPALVREVDAAIGAGSCRLEGPLQPQATTSARNLAEPEALEGEE